MGTFNGDGDEEARRVAITDVDWEAEMTRADHEVNSPIGGAVYGGVWWLASEFCALDTEELILVVGKDYSRDSQIEFIEPRYPPSQLHNFSTSGCSAGLRCTNVKNEDLTWELLAKNATQMVQKQIDDKGSERKDHLEGQYSLKIMRKSLLTPSAGGLEDLSEAEFWYYTSFDHWEWHKEIRFLEAVDLKLTFPVL